MRFRTLTSAPALSAVARTGGCALALGLGLAAGAARAADLPSRAAPPPAPVVAPLPPTWTGFYAGAHLGALFADRDSQLGFLALDCGPCATGRTASASFDGFDENDTSILGGVQAGYNWQSGLLVYGLEADISLTGDSNNRSIALSSGTLVGAGLAAITEPGADGFNGQFKTSIDWLATARARVGVATGNVLFYATGGLAFADIGVEGSYTALLGANPGVLVPVAAKDDEIRVGWTIGAGVEALLTDRLSVKLEYAYADLGRTTSQLGSYIDIPNVVRQSVSLQEDLTLHTVKVGLNYRFMGP